MPVPTKVATERVSGNRMACQPGGIKSLPLERIVASGQPGGISPRHEGAMRILSCEPGIPKAAGG